MAKVKIDETILEDVALTMSGGRLCLRWAADAWDGTLDSAAELLGVASELREVDADNMTAALYAVRGLASLRMDAEHDPCTVDADGRQPDDPEAVPDWVQPTGSHDAYPKDSHVMHNGVEWVSDMDGNVWEPGVSGWTQADGDAG